MHPTFDAVSEYTEDLLSWAIRRCERIEDAEDLVSCPETVLIFD